jgi:hypothetical protein
MFPVIVIIHMLRATFSLECLGTCSEEKYSCSWFRFRVAVWSVRFLKFGRFRSEGTCTSRQLLTRLEAGIGVVPVREWLTLASEIVWFPAKGTCLIATGCEHNYSSGLSCHTHFRRSSRAPDWSTSRVLLLFHSSALSVAWHMFPTC